jgi:hypothetical protein
VNDAPFVTVFVGLGGELLPCVYYLSGGAEVVLCPPRVGGPGHMQPPAFEALSLFVCTLMVALSDRGGKAAAGAGAGAGAGPSTSTSTSYSSLRFADPSRDIRQLCAFGRAGSAEGGCGPLRWTRVRVRIMCAGCALSCVCVLRWMRAPMVTGFVCSAHQHAVRRV